MKNIGIPLLIFKCLILAGCAGGNAIDEAVPQAAFGDAGAPVPAQRPSLEAAVVPAPKPAPQAAAAPDPLFAGSGQATQTHTYPNINREPRGAAPQMSDAERDMLLTQMQALGQAHAQGLVSSAEYRRRLAELRKLGATHSDATIKIIEN